MMKVALIHFLHVKGNIVELSVWPWASAAGVRGAVPAPLDFHT